MDQEVYYFGNQHYSPQMLRYFQSINRGILSIDIETISLDDRTPLGIGFAPNANEAFYFPIDSSEMPWHLLENPNITKLMHNGAFDLGVLKNYFEMDLYPVLDSLIEAQLQGLPLSLDDLCQHFFGIALITIESLLGKRGKNQLTMDEVPEIVVAEKCAQDVLYTMRVWEELEPFVNWPVLNLEMELQPVLVRMENYGLRIDLDRLEEHRIEVERDVLYYKGIANGMGFNPGSSKQLAAILESRGWKIQYSKKTWNPKLSKKELSTTYKDDPVSQLVLKYREKRVLLSTFIEALLNKHLVGGRIYPRVHQGVAASGRMTRTKPNTQNIPPDMRDIFIPTDGFIYEAWDLSQIELRILAYIIALETNDFTMMDAFLRDEDIHEATANHLISLGYLHGLIPYEQRRIAKTVNFAAAYRGTEHTLYVNSGIPPAQGVLFLQAYFQSYPGLNLLFDLTCANLRKDGYTETLLGRRRYFPDLDEALSAGKRMEWRVEAIYREGFNHRIQGTAGEDIKRLQVRNKTERQVNTIHDEIVFDIHPNQMLNRDSIHNLAIYRTPMTVSRAMDWKALSDDKNKVGRWG